MQELHAATLPRANSQNTSKTRLQDAAAPWPGAHGQDKDDDGNWRDRWRIEVDDAPVPLDQRLTLSVSLAEGCKPHGWFRVVLTAADGAKHTLVDRRDLMQHPKDPRPDGVNAFNPMKHHTSKELVDFVRGRGKNLMVLWDDRLQPRDDAIANRPVEGGHRGALAR